MNLQQKLDLLPPYIRDQNGQPKFLYIWKDDDNQYRVHYTQWGKLTPFEFEKGKLEDAVDQWITKIKSNN